MVYVPKSSASSHRKIMEQMRRRRERMQVGRLHVLRQQTKLGRTEGESATFSYIQPMLFRTFVLEQLRFLPLLTQARCEVARTTSSDDTKPLVRQAETASCAIKENIGPDLPTGQGDGHTQGHVAGYAPNLATYVLFCFLITWVQPRRFS